MDTACLLQYRLLCCPYSFCDQQATGIYNTYVQRQLGSVSQSKLVWLSLGDLVSLSLNSSSYRYHKGGSVSSWFTHPAAGAFM